MRRTVTKTRKERSLKWLIWPCLGLVFLAGLLIRTAVDSRGSRPERPEYAREMPRGGQVAMSWSEKDSIWRLMIRDNRGVESPLKLGEFSSEDAIQIFYRVVNLCPGGPLTSAEAKEMIEEAGKLSRTLPAQRSVPPGPSYRL